MGKLQGTSDHLETVVLFTVLCCVQNTHINISVLEIIFNIA